MKNRSGNNPKRRVQPFVALTVEQRDILIKSAKYVGSGHHKRYPSNYGYQRTNPIPTKSLCDSKRIITKEEAHELMLKGIERGMVSEIRENGFPKYIWSVSEHGEVFESKTDSKTGEYHGYPIEDEDTFFKHIKSQWEERCKARAP